MMKRINVFYLLHVRASVPRCVDHYEGDTPPPLVRSIQGVFRRYAVRKGSVRNTQKSCYIVRRHQFLLLKGLVFIKKYKKPDIQSQIYLFLRALACSRCPGPF